MKFISKIDGNHCSVFDTACSIVSDHNISELGELEKKYSIKIYGYSSNGRLRSFSDPVNVLNRVATELKLAGYHNAEVEDCASGVRLLSCDVNVNTLIIPASITELGSKCFCGNDKIERVSIKSDYFKEIGVACFSQCESLRSIELPQGIEKFVIVLFYIAPVWIV